MHSMKALLLTLALASAGGANAAQPPISVGDTVEIFVSGFPDLQRRAVVDEDGDISYATLGTVKAAGLSAGKLRDILAEDFVKADLLKDPKISVDIVLRQPIYVTGAVAKPGVQAYVGNLTVRSALALAGGLDLTGTHGLPPSTSQADPQGQYETLALDLVRSRTRMRMLEAELTDQATFKPDKFADLPVADEVVTKLIDLKSRELKARVASAENEKASLRGVVRELQVELAALAEQKKAVEDSIRQQGEQLAKIRNLADHAIVAHTRVLEEQRSMDMLTGKLYRLYSDYCASNAPVRGS